MGIYAITITKSLGGNSTKDTWNNTHHVAVDVDVDSEAMKGVVDYIVDAEKELHADQVYFTNAHVVQVAENALNRPKDEFRSIGLSGTGKRVTMGDELDALDRKLLPLDITLAVQRSTSKGRPGMLYFRGALVESDLEQTANNSFALKEGWLADLLDHNVNDFITKMKGDLPSGAINVIPDPVDTILEQFAQGSRMVVDYTVKSVIIRQRTAKRKRTDTALVGSANRNLSEMARTVKKLQGSGMANTVDGALVIADIALKAGKIIKAVPVLKLALLRVPPVIRALPGI